MQCGHAADGLLLWQINGCPRLCCMVNSLLDSVTVMHLKWDTKTFWRDPSPYVTLIVVSGLTWTHTVWLSFHRAVSSTNKEGRTYQKKKMRKNITYLEPATESTCCTWDCPAIIQFVQFYSKFKAFSLWYSLLCHTSARFNRHSFRAIFIMI